VEEIAYPILWESDRRDDQGLRIPVWRVWYPIPVGTGARLGRPRTSEAAARQEADIWNAARARGGPTEQMKGDRP
jgi:hypothetical protein